VSSLQIAHRYREYVDIFRKGTNRSSRDCELWRKSRKMQNHVVKLAPAILAADFARLGEQVADAEQAGPIGFMWM
jgi:hypothetical protein